MKTRPSTCRFPHSLDLEWNRANVIELKYTVQQTYKIMYLNMMARKIDFSLTCNKGCYII